jgi:Cdc6-like AAA superfamily ATPase
MNSELNIEFLKFKARAELVDPNSLVDSFVKVGPVSEMLESENHQIMYGRRGTGKTHVLNYVADQVQNDGNFAIYVDLRTVGSSTGIFADPQYSLSDRATRLHISDYPLPLSVLIEFYQFFNC